MTDNTNSKDTAALMWILAIFFSWLTSLIFYLTKKDDAFVQEESKLALNLSINYIILVFVIAIASGILGSIAGILSMICSLLILVVFAGWVYICILHRKSVLQGTPKPKIPYAITFIK